MSTAWNIDGDVERKFNIPFGAMRKAYFGYKAAIHLLSKLTLNGVTYDFDKQAKEGLVVCGYQYDPLTFFLPDNREPMTAEQGASMTINSYLDMIATTDYAEIIAWDYFVKWLADRMGILESPDIDIDTTAPVQYSLQTISSPQCSVTGSCPLNEFMGIQTFKEFFAILHDNMSASDDPLSNWMTEDGAVAFNFSITAAVLEGQSLSYVLIVGRK